MDPRFLGDLVMNMEKKCVYLFSSQIKTKKSTNLLSQYVCVCLCPVKLNTQKSDFEFKALNAHTSEYLYYPWI